MDLLFLLLKYLFSNFSFVPFVVKNILIRNFAVVKLSLNESVTQL